MDLNRIKLFPEYVHLSELPKKEDLGRDLIPVSSDSELLHTIFAPDPVSGYPRPDLAILLSKDSAPEVSQYIRDTLLIPHDSTFVDDADFALASIKHREESVIEYGERLRNLISNNE